MVVLYIKRLTTILAFFFVFIGCAVSPDLINSIDPYEEQNRKVHEFNERVIKNLIEPVTGAYVEATPPFVRERVTDFFENIDDVKSGSSVKINLNPNDTLIKLDAIKTSLQRGQIPIGEIRFGIYGNESAMGDINDPAEDFIQAARKKGMSYISDKEYGSGSVEGKYRYAYKPSQSVGWTQLRVGYGFTDPKERELLAEADEKFGTNFASPLNGSNGGYDDVRNHPDYNTLSKEDKEKASDPHYIQWYNRCIQELDWALQMQGEPTHDCYMKNEKGTTFGMSW